MKKLYCGAYIEIIEKSVCIRFHLQYFYTINGHTKYRF